MTWSWFAEGGAIMGLLLAVGIALYTLLSRVALGLAAGERFGPDALTVPRALIGLAPLLGLLGTVTGVIESFEALVGGGPGLGEGIGMALRTTQYGLTLAAPALLWERALSRRISLHRPVESDRALRTPRPAHPSGAEAGSNAAPEGAGGAV